MTPGATWSGISAMAPFQTARGSAGGQGANRENGRRDLRPRREHRVTSILTFVSRAEHLVWRQKWKNGRWCILSPTPEFRASILRQDEIYRQADAAWLLHHGPIPGGAKLVQFPQPQPSPSASLVSTGGVSGG